MDNLTWLDTELGIIHWTFRPDMTVDEMLIDFDTFREMAESVSCRTYPILDFTGAGTIPSDIVMHYPEMQKRLPTGDKRAALIAVVSNKTFINALMNIFSRLYQDQFAFFQTFDAAYLHVRSLAEQALADV
jgi:hypothetical protein